MHLQQEKHVHALSIPKANLETWNRARNAWIAAHRELSAAITIFDEQMQHYLEGADKCPSADAIMYLDDLRLQEWQLREALADVAREEMGIRLRRPDKAA